MKITIELDNKEKECLAIFKDNAEPSTIDNFKGFGNTTEFGKLQDAKLIYHCNRHVDGDYIRYALTELGKLALKLNS